MTTCTRRPRTTWTTCLCPPCTDDRNRLTKLARNGYYTRIPSHVGWAVIDKLRAQGWTGQAIASAANLPRYTIERAITADEQGKRRRLSPGTTAALVAHGDPKVGGVGAHGTRRRLQGLARQGYDLQTIADATGIGFSTVASIRNREEAEFVKARFYVTIRDYTESVGIKIGPSQLAVKHATRKGWPSLWTWDDIDTDAKPAAAYQEHRRRDEVDEAVVLRLLDGERIDCTSAERHEAMRRWKAAGRSEKEMCRLQGWKDSRYGRTAA